MIRVPRISLRQLAYFESLARHLHFGRAAEASAVSQPALSVQIRELERELGTVLLERGRGGVALTPQGEYVARHGRRILGGVKDLVEGAPRAQIAGAIRLGVIPTVAPYLMPVILGPKEQGGASFQVQVRESQTRRLIEELEQGSLDVLILALPVVGPGLESMPLFSDPFLLAVPASAAMPAEVAGVGDVAPLPLLLLEEGHCLRDQALSVCSMADKQLLASLGATSLPTLLELVAAGMGATLLPELCRPGAEGDARIRLVPFRAPAPSRTLGLVWRRTSTRKPAFRQLGNLVARARGAPVSVQKRALVPLRRRGPSRTPPAPG